MCGIIGIVSKSPVNQAIYDGLTVLQHRGQDAAGIMTCEGNNLYLRKDNGLVRDVLKTRHMLNLKGNMGIGHVRYPTAGCSSSAEAQPFYVNSPYGITLAHNGNLVNAELLKEDLMRDDLRHLNTNSDSEVLLNILAHELNKIGKHRNELTSDDIFSAVNRLHKRCKGGYAAVAMITGVGIVGFRDPNGIRPIVFGERKTDIGTESIIASESVAVDALDFQLVRDIEPGEAVFISVEGETFTKKCSDNISHSPCIFEYVYLARPDSIIDGISVYKARLRMGKTLARKILRLYPMHDIDVVIPIPDSSRTAALSLANEIGITYREGFVKNRYITRTFIMPGQNIRKKSVRQKLNAINLEFKDKNVLLVDDSIVRGTTSREIVQMAKEAGAKRVYIASAAPPVRHPNVYGIDMPSVSELIAYDRSVEEIAKTIGADWLVYQDIDDLISSAHKGNKLVSKFDASCFTGEYVTGDVNADYLARLELLRSDAVKETQNIDEGLMDLTSNQ
ncbi:MAG: amidophosphoribosyltransferase [Gammaproteobacteria bacterium]|tara:strand:- start:74 stop:1588 length:1515 start_codon:yes stop_codon:yes gene_type:complete